tara:strand:- start:142 stop:639 length:498 start_codon:yes stop_codon:yes gene_type:complete
MNIVNMPKNLIDIIISFLNIGEERNYVINEILEMFLNDILNIECKKNNFLTDKIRCFHRRRPNFWFERTWNNLVDYISMLKPGVEQLINIFALNKKIFNNLQYRVNIYVSLASDLRTYGYDAPIFDINDLTLFVDNDNSIKVNYGTYNIFKTRLVLRKIVFIIPK